MPCIVIKKLAAATLLTISAAAAASNSDQPPRFLTVPVLGLRVPIDRINLDAFPEDLRVTCGQIDDNEVHTVRVWIFGRAKEAGAMYYIITGYFKRRNPEHGQRLFEYWDNGSVFTVSNGKCGGDDADETFATHDPNADNDGNVPDRILRVLAFDLATQTVRAVGGPERLRDEIKRQRIDFNRLPPELQEAFKPYFGPMK